MTNNQPKVSVIIPIWNTEKYLEKCLESVTNQTLKDIEIICVNNGSTDSCPQIIDKFAKKDSRIKIVNKEHGCLSSARNAGMEVATAPYMTFVDSDDWVEPQCYEFAVKEFEKDAEIDLVCWGANIINIDLPEDSQNIKNCKNYHKIKVTGKHKLTDDIINKTTVCVWNKMFKTDIINSNNISYPVGIEMEDNAFFYTYWINCKYAYYINEYFYNYVQRRNSCYDKILSKESPIIAPHIRNLGYVIRYFEQHNSISTKKDFILYKLKGFLKFDYESSLKGNELKVISEAFNLGKMLINYPEFKNNLLIQNLNAQNYENVIAIIKNKPIYIWKNFFASFSKNYDESKYMFKIFGIKFTFKNRRTN